MRQQRTLSTSLEIATHSEQTLKVHATAIPSISATQTTIMLKAKATQQRKATTLPTETVEYLKNWMMSPEHINHPYPTEREKAQIMADTGIGVKPLTNWFVNNRKRYWKPRYEARLQQQKTEAANNAKMAGGTAPLQGVPASTSVLITASPPPQSTIRQYLGRRVSIDASTISSRNGLISTNMTSSLRHHASPAVRAVSVGSASSLSSELSDGNSFDDDDSVAFASPGRKVEIILDLKRSRCATLDSSDDDDCYGSPTKRCRTTAKKITVRRIPHHESPRSQYVGKDTTPWRSVCVNAGSGFEHALPTLEEAAHMFGHNQ